MSTEETVVEHSPEKMEAKKRNVATMMNAAAALFAASTLCADVHAYHYDYAPRIPPTSPDGDVVSSFVCHMSFDDFGNYQTVSDHQVCNGMAECPEGEDEAGCGSLDQVQQQPEFIAAAAFPMMNPSDKSPLREAVGEERGMMMPPMGFIRLPDKLQQKEYGYGFGAPSIEEGKAVPPDRLTNTDPTIYCIIYQILAGGSNVFDESECKYLPPPLSSACSIPWVRSNTRWYYDSTADTCLPFEYGAYENTFAISERPDMMSASEGAWKSGRSKGGCVNFILQISSKCGLVGRR